jgi:hypothetical protein
MTQNEDRVLMPKLEHLQFYREHGFDNFKEIDTSCLPNLKSVDVKCAVKIRLTEAELRPQLTFNPLQNLMHLKNFGVEFKNIDCFKYLSSPNLENLTIFFEKFFYKTETWTQIAENLPNLQQLVIKGIDDEDFLNFITEYIEDLLYLTENDKLKILKLHFLQDDLEIFFNNKKVVKCIGYSCEKYSQLFCSQELIRKRFTKFDFTLLTKDEFRDKFDHLTVDSVTKSDQCHDRIIVAHIYLN